MPRVRFGSDEMIERLRQMTDEEKFAEFYSNPYQRLVMERLDRIVQLLEKLLPEEETHA